MEFKNKLYSIFTGTCPACIEGKMWRYSPYKLSKMTEMNKMCPKCNTNLEPEPMFYTGAMYVGYGFTVAIMFSVFVAANVLFEDPNINVMFWSVVAIAVVFAPLNLRLSRNIWANIFIQQNTSKNE